MFSMIALIKVNHLLIFKLKQYLFIIEVLCQNCCNIRRFGKHRPIDNFSDLARIGLAHGIQKQYLHCYHARLK